MDYQLEWVDYTNQILKVGMLIEWVNGKVSLMGDINTEFGVCDDCMTDKIDMSDRYKYNDGQLIYNSDSDFYQTVVKRIAYLLIPDDILKQI